MLRWDGQIVHLSELGVIKAHTHTPVGARTLEDIHREIRYREREKKNAILTCGAYMCTRQLERRKTSHITHKHTDTHYTYIYVIYKKKMNESGLASGSRA